MKKYFAILMLAVLLLTGCPSDGIDDKTRTGENETNTTEVCYCLANYIPVCGQDGITYDNSCKAECEGVEVAHDGLCEDDIDYCGEDGECPEGMSCSENGICEEYFPVTKCDINGQETWAKGQFMYYEDYFDREYLYISAGYYIRKEDKSGWLFRHHVDTDSNHYTKTMDAMVTGVTYWGEEIVCEETEEDLPEGFQTFLDTHNVKYEEYVLSNVEAEE